MMRGWTRPAAWTAVALAAAWLRVFVVHAHLHGGLTVIALVSAVVATVAVLELVAGRHSRRE